MELLEFRKQVAAIQREKFKYQGESLFECGLRRAQFRQQKFQRLVDLAKKYPPQYSAKRLSVWERGIEKSLAAQKRFQSMINRRDEKSVG